MKNTISIVLCCIACAVSSAENQTSVKEDVVPGVVIIRVLDQNSIESVLATSVMDQFQVRQVKRLMDLHPGLQKNSAFQPLRAIFELHFGADVSPNKVAQQLAKNKNVVYAEPKYIHYTDQIGLNPNDSLYWQQTHFNSVQAAAAWNLIRGQDGNVVIAVIDGGTEIKHPDLASNIWINQDEVPGDSVDNDGNGWTDDIYGWNFANNTGDPTGLPESLFNANHGTHTGGIVGAATDNNSGVAGGSWNATMMAVNVSNPVNNTIQFGYDGILYAVQNGARVLSCSWGRGGGQSSYEQDVINSATAAGAVVVASAGNDAHNLRHYPSSYNNVLSVTATDNGGFKLQTANFGPTVDLAAPGFSILSTYINGGYGRLSGTSMSCPLVSGAVGLVLTQHPEWQGIQAAEQVRVTTDNIDVQNPAFVGKLGRGRLNMFRALSETLPSIRITDISINETNGNDIIDPGETVNVLITVKNYLQAASNVSVTLATDDPYVTLITSNLVIPTIGTLETQQLSQSFSFVVAAQSPSGHRIDFKLGFSSGIYDDFDLFQLTILPTLALTSASNINLSVTNVGRIGANGTEQIGFSYKNGSDLLFEGAVIAGTSADQISNAARAVDGLSDEDFTVATNGDIQVISPGLLSTEETIGVYEDTEADIPLNIRITQETYASDMENRDDFVTFKFIVENKNDYQIENFHFGLFLDWDVDGETFPTNRVAHDSIRNMGYVYDTGTGPDTYVGMLPLSTGDHSFRAIYNEHDNPANPSWGLFDGFTDAEKWESISGGTLLTTAGPADVSCVIGWGPYTLGAYTRAQIGFALVAADDLTQLKMHADSALSFWQEIKVAGISPSPDPPLAYQFKLQQNYPNPFNPETVISYTIAKQQFVFVTLFNTAGQHINTLVSERQNAGEHQTSWNGRDQYGRVVATGIYFCRLQAGESVSTRKMLLLR